MLKKMLLLIFCLSYISQAEMLISSQSHIKVQSGYDIIVNNDQVLVATDGGVFRFSCSDNSYSNPDFFGVETGLPGIKVAGACKDSRGNYWFASSEGVLSVQNNDFEKIAAFNDVITTNSNSLISVAASEKYIYLVTDKALVRYVYNPSIDKYQVKDSNLNAGTIRAFGINHGVIYLFSDKLRYISEDAPNISDIGLWSINNFPVAKGINQFKQLENKFLALASDGLYELTGENSTKLSILNDKNVLYANEFAMTIGGKTEIPSAWYFLVKKTDDIRYVCHTNNLANEPTEDFYFNDEAFTKFAMDYKNFYCLSSDNGFKIYEYNAAKFSNPLTDQPILRSLSDACYSGSKIVYGNNQHVAMGDYQKKSWSNALTKLSGMSDHTRFLSSTTNTVLGAYWGRGINIYNLVKSPAGKDSVAIKDQVVFQSSSSSGAPYPISYACTKDKNGGLWFGNFYVDYLDAATTPVIVKLPSLNQSSSEIVQNSLKFYMNDIQFKHTSCMVIDNQSRIWIAAKQQDLGLAMITVNPNNTATSKKADVVFEVYSLAIDQKNILWIGTNMGVKYVELDKVNAGNFDDSKIKSVTFTPAGQQVFNIHITENNEKWFATTGGVTILKNNDQDVYHLIQNYSIPESPLSGTVEEIPMLSKGVLNIIELPLTKQKLFVFQEGFVVYDFAKGSVRNEISEAVTLPAPFLNDGSAEVSFYIPDNGINYKFVKIFDLKGRLVKKITTNFSGNRITWNGKGDDGELASSGVYQFIVYSEENSQEFLRGKMAIVRK